MTHTAMFAVTLHSQKSGDQELDDIKKFYACRESYKPSSKRRCQFYLLKLQTYNVREFQI